MKHIKTAVLVITLFTFVAIACGNENPVDSVIQTENIGEKINLETVSTLSIGDLTSTITEALIFMREEEKLARDIYAMMYKTHSLKPFTNINKSEQTHMDAIKTLLLKYEIEDPVKNDEAGVFKNTELQKLYQKLIDAEKISVTEALKVGAAVEEIDILDLKKHLSELNNNDDIKYVYEKLMKASENHLRAFVRNLVSRGIVYTPQYLDQKTFDSIIE